MTDSQQVRIDLENPVTLVGLELYETLALVWNAGRSVGVNDAALERVTPNPYQQILDEFKAHHGV